MNRTGIFHTRLQEYTKIFTVLSTNLKAVELIYRATVADATRCDLWRTTPGDHK